MSKPAVKCAVFVVLLLSPMLLWAPWQLMYLVITIAWISACAFIADKVVDYSIKSRRE